MRKGIINNSGLKYACAVKKNIYIFFLLYNKCWPVTHFIIVCSYESPEGSYEIRDTKFAMRNTEYEIRDTKFEIRKASTR